MKVRYPLLMCLSALLVVAGCASTEVTSRDQAVAGKLPRPATVWVYDFAASPEDVPAESALAGQHSQHTVPQTDEQIKTGRQLGAEIEAELVKLIRGMGMNAQHAEKGTQPQIDDLVIRGYLVTFNEGNAAKRILIGFGSGASDLKVAVEGFQMTAGGLRKLGSGTTDATGGKMPGADMGAVALIATHNPLGLIVSSGLKIYNEESGKSTVKGRAEQTAKEIADILQKRFQQEGWID